MKNHFLRRSVLTALTFSLLSSPFATLPTMPTSIAHVEAAAQTTTTIPTMQKQEARTFVVTGTIQTKVGTKKDWDPADMTTRMKPMGNDFYEYEADLPAGDYFYKISVNGSWAENYGLHGAFDGPNIQFSLPKAAHVVFYYNDKTHKVADSTSYNLEADKDLPRLKGLPSGEKVMRDDTLSHFYQTTAPVQKGEYHLSVQAPDGQTKAKLDAKVKQAGEATFSYDAAQSTLAMDDGSIDRSKLFHDTWDERYRAPFHAIQQGEPITFGLAVGAGQANDVELLLQKADIKAQGGDEYNPTFEGASVTKYKMTKVETKDGSDLWTVTLHPEAAGMYGYRFLVDNSVEYGDDAKVGHVGEPSTHEAKPFPLTVYTTGYHTPEWAKEAVVYQIFPDRFYNGDPSNDNARKYARGFQPIQHRKWNQLPANHAKTPDKDEDLWDCNDFFGGDLKGIEKKLDYLQDLGVTAIYLNPIMNAASNHRYDAVDYGTIDPMLGTMDDFRNLSKAMQKRGMRLIMDGVFNHIGDDSIYFDRYSKYPWVGGYEYWARIYDLMNKNPGMDEATAKQKARTELIAEGQKFSPYGWENWFEVKNEKGKDEMGEKYLYHDWQGYSSLVPFRDSDFPTDSGKGNTQLGEYLLYGKDAVLTKWFREGLSGWRLDVAKEVPPTFWRAVRTEIKNQKTPDGQEPLLLGEIWQDGTHFLTGDQLDSVMNYKLFFALGDLYLLKDDARAMEDELMSLRQNYPVEALYDLMNIIDSHDTVRAIYRLGGGEESVGRPTLSENVAQPTLKDFDYKLGKARLKLAEAFLMTYPGMPTIYYGDEVGLFGGADPDDRRPFPWNHEDKDLYNYYKTLVHLRTSHPQLYAHGDLQTLYANKGLYAFIRQGGDMSSITVMNRDAKTDLTFSVPLVDGTTLTDALQPTFKVTVKDGQLTIPLAENQARVLLTEGTK